MGVHFLGDIKEEDFLKLKLRRVIPFSRFLYQLETVPSLWFSNPEKWNDPYEARFLNVKYEIASGTQIECPWKKQIFGCCFTTKNVSYEPDWLLYASNDKSIRILYDNATILRYLKNFADKNQWNVYIGMVSYLSLKEIETPNILTNTLGSEILSQEKFVQLLFLKRAAYKFEDELRIIIVLNDKTEGNGLSLDFSIEDRNSLFKNLMLGPTFSLEEQKLWKLVLTELLDKPITYNDFFKNPVFTKAEPSKRIKWTVLYHLQDKFKTPIKLK